MRNQAQTKNSHTNHSSPIRNLGAFFKAYLSSESGKRALTRQPKLVEKKVDAGKGKLIEWKEPQGFNTLAHAFNEAFNG